MSVNSVFTALMNQVRRITGVSGTLTPEAATAALANTTPGDLSGVTATAQTVLTGYDFVNAQGQKVSGTMANNGAVSGTLTPTASTYTIPSGYHNGSGSVGVSAQAKTVSFTPDGTKQTITPDSGKFMKSLSVYPCRMKTYMGTFEWERSDILPTMSKVFVIPANPVLNGHLPTQYELTIFTDMTKEIDEANPQTGDLEPIVEPYIAGVHLHRDVNGNVTTDWSYIGPPMAGLENGVQIRHVSSAATVQLEFVTTPVAGYKVTVAWNGDSFDSMDLHYERGCRYILTAWESVPTDTPLAQGDPA